MPKEKDTKENIKVDKTNIDAVKKVDKNIIDDAMESEKVTIKYRSGGNKYTFQVDKLIAPLISEMCDAKICTSGAFQNDVKGYVLVDFISPADGTKFINIVYKFPNNSLKKRMHPESKLKDKWIYDLSMVKPDLGILELDNQLYITFSVRFPQKDIDTVYRQMQYYNNKYTVYGKLRKFQKTLIV
jgi:hypothetical protein